MHSILPLQSDKAWDASLGITGAQDEPTWQEGWGGSHGSGLQLGQAMAAARYGSAFDCCALGSTHLPAPRASSIGKPALGDHQGRGSLQWPDQGPTPWCPPVVGPLGDIRFALQLGDARKRSRCRACVTPSSRISCKRSWARGHGPAGRCASVKCGALWLR